MTIGPRQREIMSAALGVNQTLVKAGNLCFMVKYFNREIFLPQALDGFPFRDKLRDDVGAS